MAATRDPLSEWFDPAARRLITRAYKRRGQWTGVFLAPPSITQRAYAARLGIYDLYERDRWGEQRWVRAYKRSVYYQLGKHGYADGPRWGEERLSGWPAVALEWQTGQRVARANWAGRDTRRSTGRAGHTHGGSAAWRPGQTTPTAGHGSLVACA